MKVFFRKAIIICIVSVIISLSILPGIAGFADTLSNETDYRAENVLKAYSGEEWSIKDYKDGKITLTAPDNAESFSNPRIYIANYKDNEALTDVEVIDIPAVNGKTDYEVQTKKNFDESFGGLVKIMLWDGSMSPLCEPFTVNAANDLIKLSGIAVENSVTALDDWKLIDTSLPNTVVIEVSESSNVFKPGERYTFYTGDTNADELLGRRISAQVRGGDDKYTIYSISDMQTDDSMTSFIIDKFVGFEQTDKSCVVYKKNNDETDKLVLSDDLKIIYNNRHCYKLNTADSLFGDTGFLSKNPDLGGEILFVDNNADGEYDVAFVKVGCLAVVSEVTKKGRVLLEDYPGNYYEYNAIRDINFSQNSSDTIIKLTKDGKPYDYKNLMPGNILFIVHNSEQPDDYYEIEVLDNSAVIEGIIADRQESDTSSNGYSYMIEFDGKTGNYEPSIYCSLNELYIGAKGKFYIDKYGKIAKFCRYVPPINYGYIISGTAEEDGAGVQNLSLQVAYRDGSIGVYDFPENLIITNPNDVIKKVLDDNSFEVVYRYKDLDIAVNQSVIDSIVGKIVIFNENDRITNSITLEADKYYDEETLALQCVDTSNSSEYDEKEALLKSNRIHYCILDDTIVFYVGGKGDNYTYGKPAVGADIKVIDGSKLASFWVHPWQCIHTSLWAMRT